MKELLCSVRSEKSNKSDADRVDRKWDLKPNKDKTINEVKEIS